MNAKAAPIFLAFLCMGFGDAAATFVGKAKSAFELGNFEAQLVSFAGFIMFGLLSIPMGLLQARISKKYTLLAGLFMELAGVLLILVFGVRSYAVFLASVFLLGAGAAILQVSGNPIMRDVSAPGAYSSNLSMAQFVKAIGSNTAPIAFFVMAYMGVSGGGSGFEWTVLFCVFAASIIAALLSVSALKIKESKAESAASVGSCFALLKNPFVAAAVFGIFVYVGAENCISNGMPIYFAEVFGISGDIATKYVFYFFLCVMAGRLAGAAILRKLPPRTFLLASAAFSIAGFAILALNTQTAAVAALVVIALGYSNIFPLIFSIAIDKMPDKSDELSGLMVTAIVGAALIPPAMGVLADLSGVLAGFFVPFAATVYIVLLSARWLNRV